MKQLASLSKPFAKRFVKKPPTGKYGDYVPHHIVNQKLLLDLGPFGMKVTKEIRGLAPEFKTKDGTIYPAVENALVGVWLECTFHIDGREVPIEEAGHVENAAMEDNDGARAKEAISDALKRCAMRVGCGLHLWSQSDYILHDQLAQRSEGSGPRGRSPERVESRTEPDGAASDPQPKRSESRGGQGEVSAATPDPEDAFWNKQEAKA